MLNSYLQTWRHGAVSAGEVLFYLVQTLCPDRQRLLDDAFQRIVRDPGPAFVMRKDG